MTKELSSWHSSSIKHYQCLVGTGHNHLRFGLVWFFKGFEEPWTGLLVQFKMVRFLFASGPNYKLDFEGHLEEAWLFSGEVTLMQIQKMEAFDPHSHMPPKMGIEKWGSCSWCKFGGQRTSIFNLICHWRLAFRNNVTVLSVRQHWCEFRGQKTLIHAGMLPKTGI